MKKIPYLPTLKDKGAKLKSFLTSGTKASYITIGTASAIALIGASIGAITIISYGTTGPDTATSSGTSAIVAESGESETTSIALAEMPTTTEAEVNAMTTTAKATEQTTEAASLPPETTTAQMTAISETINMADLDIQDDSVSDETEPVRQEIDVEPETEPQTTKAVTKTTSSTATSKAATTSKASTSTKTGTASKTGSTAASGTGTKASVNENANAVIGIDISKWNSLYKKDIDWKKVKDSGVSFVIIRAGYRSISSTAMYEDPYFEEHIEGALAAGLQVGVYFYSQAITEKEALEEASFLLSIIKGYDITYPVCFDWEPTSDTRAKNANLSKAQVTKIAEKFLSTIEGYGYEAMLYSYHSALKDYFNMDKLSKYKTWVAYYYAKYKNTGVEYKIGDPIPEEDYPYQMWQYTSTGTIPGIEGVVDVNVAFMPYSNSGTPVSAITFNLPSTTYTTDINTTIDYESGVKAYDSAGFDISASVTSSIKNSKGATVSASEAFKNAGIYTITYTAKDFTGGSKSVTATLTVQSLPTITLAENELTLNRTEMDYEAILSAVKNNVTAAHDFNNTVLDASAITISGLEAIMTSDSSNAEISTNEQTADETVNNDNTANIKGSNGENTDAEGSDIESSDIKGSNIEDSGKENSNSGNTEDANAESSDKESSVNESSETEDLDKNANTGNVDNEYSAEQTAVDTNGILAGDFTITYTATDSYGLSNSISIMLHIIP